MPYHIVKKINLLSKGSSFYLPSFGIDLEDDKTWSYYKLHVTPPPKIRAKVLALFCLDGVKRDVVEKTYDFLTGTNCYYTDGTNTKEIRVLYIPNELVRAYAIDENMAIDLVLEEVHYFWEKVVIFKSKMIEGAKDIELKIDDKIDTKELAQEITKNANQYNTFLEFW